LLAIEDECLYCSDFESDVDEDDIDDFEEEDGLQDLFVRILEDIQLNLP